MAQMDLMLYLIRQRIGRELADLVMSYLLIDTRTTQARYQVWEHVALTDDETARNFEALIEASLPAGRLGRPEDIAATALLLAGPGGDFYIGACLSPNGGDVMH